MRDSGDVCGARNTQFEQEFLGLFLGETVSVYDWRDRIGDFCVADYLAELDKVHPVRYSTIQSDPTVQKLRVRPTHPTQRGFDFGEQAFFQPTDEKSDAEALRDWESEGGRS